MFTAKSKVAPHTTLTIPGLQLLGCHLLNKFVDSVKRAVEICFWWIKSVDTEWKVRVENWANAIHALTDVDLWKFVPGNCNTSDIGTKKQIYGLSFLLFNPCGWPKPKQSSSEAFDDNENVETHMAVTKDVSNSDICVERLNKNWKFLFIRKAVTSDVWCFTI